LLCFKYFILFVLFFREEPSVSAGSLPIAPVESPPKPNLSCRAVITGAVPGTQAERALKEKNMMAYYVNSSIVAVNGKATKG
jgi:hypothetical protein